jgi:hypothetical protein
MSATKFAKLAAQISRGLGESGDHEDGVQYTMATRRSGFICALIAQRIPKMSRAGTWEPTHGISEPPIPQIYIHVRQRSQPERRGIQLAQFLSLKGEVFNIFQSATGQFGVIPRDDTEVIKIESY